MAHNLDLEQLQADFSKGKRVAEIARGLGVTHKVVAKRLKDMGYDLPNHRRNCSAEQEIEITRRYLEGEKTKVLATHFSVSGVTIHNIVRRHGGSIRPQGDDVRKYTHDENFFEVIDTKEKAYLLGLWMADGCNVSNGNVVSLALTDRELIDLGKKLLKYTGPIYKSERTNCADIFTLCISSQSLSNSLSAQGCGFRKSLTMSFPSKVPYAQMSHFVRGYFDGDGCIHRRKQSDNFTIHILGSENFCRGLQNMIPVKSFVHQRAKQRIWFLGIYNRRDVRIFCEWLYRDSDNLRLERKFDTARYSID